MQTAKKTSREQIGRWVLLLGVSGLLVAHALTFNFLNDDAFISFRYADNLASHGELVFNLGERVEGYTNFLWTVLMAGILFIGLDPAIWSRILGITCAVLILWITTRFMDREMGHTKLSNILPAGLLALAPAFACWATGGLETQLFTLLLTMGVLSYLDVRRGTSTSYLPVGLYFALAAMTRPEAVLVAGLVGVLHLLWKGFSQRSWRCTRSESAGIGIFVLVYGLYTAWRWTYYGWPFPNTYYVKAGADPLWSSGWYYFSSWVIDHGLWMTPFIVLAIGRAHRRFLAVAIPIFLLYIVHVVRVGGDFMGLHRFFVPIMPLVAVVLALGLVNLANWLSSRSSRWLTIALTIVMTIGVVWHVRTVGLRAMQVGSERGIDRIGWLKMFHGQCEAIGRWLNENSEKDAAIATTAAGIIPYYSKRYTVDILGLNDEWIAHNVREQ